MSNISHNLVRRRWLPGGVSAFIRVPISAFAIAMLLAACRPTANTPLHVPATSQPVQRFTVVLVGVFEDDLAYNDRRGIYTIKDNLTGKEYVGISGVGISETGYYMRGKNSASDER